MRRLVAQRGIPFFKIGKFVRFDTDDIGQSLDHGRPLGGVGKLLAVADPAATKAFLKTIAGGAASRRPPLPPGTRPPPRHRAIDAGLLATCLSRVLERQIPQPTRPVLAPRQR